MPYPEVAAVLTDIGTEEIGHFEMVAAIVHQLTRDMTIEQIKEAGFEDYFVDHTAGIYAQAAAGFPFDALSTDYSGEMSFYSYVKQGQTKEVRERLDNDTFAMNTKKKLSADPIQSIRYHFVVTAGLLARFCIEGGMESNQAYEMSDYYILKADRLTTLKDLCALHREMCLDYTRQMEIIRKKKIYSKPVAKSIDYIYSHLHCRIAVAEVAEYVGLNENYFSRLFTKEVGTSVSHYILQRKLEVAQNMLKYSDYSCSQISELLCFASQSHFIDRFHKEYGMTPLHYRNRYHSDMGLKEE